MSGYLDNVNDNDNSDEDEKAIEPVSEEEQIRIRAACEELRLAGNQSFKDEHYEDALQKYTVSDFLNAIPCFLSSYHIHNLNCFRK